MPLVPTADLLGRSAAVRAGLAAFNEWYDGPVGTRLRETFRFTESTLANGQPNVTTDSRSGEETASARSLPASIWGANSL